MFPAWTPPARRRRDRQTWAGTSPSVLLLGALTSPSVGCSLAPPIDMQVARLVARASRSARLPARLPSPHAIPPTPHIPRGQANTQTRDIIPVAFVWPSSPPVV